LLLVVVVMMAVVEMEVVTVFVVVEATHRRMWYGGIDVRVTHVSHLDDNDGEFPKTWFNSCSGFFWFTACVPIVIGYLFF